MTGIFLRGAVPLPDLRPISERMEAGVSVGVSMHAARYTETNVTSQA